MFLFTIASQKTTKVNTPVTDFFGAPQLHWRDKDSRYFTYEKVDRGHQRFRIIEVDAETADTRTVLDEQTNTFIYEQKLFTHYLPATHEILLTSEKDGWRHIYLVDAISGKEQAVTKGEWIVRDIDSIDTKKKEIWFSASGMIAGEDPYYIHYYRIGFDGRHLVSLTTAKANHIVTFSPDKKYYLDAYSEINVPTITELHRTEDGKKVMEVERADASDYLASGLRLPEPFHAKGRDGVTDIWGIVCRPADFDSTKRYPVIENIYAGPQASFVPKDFTSRYGEMQSIAQMGFMLLGLCSGVVYENTVSAANSYASSMFYIVTYVLTTLGSFGMIKEKLGRMAMRCYASESLCYLVSSTIDRGGVDYSVEGAATKVFNSESLWTAADEALQIAGGMGYMREQPYERIVRDTRINRIFEGTNEINRLIIPATLLKRIGQGGLPYMEFLKQVDKEIAEGASWASASAGALEREFRATEVSKRLVAYITRVLVEKDLASLKDKQQHLEILSNMIIDVFAMDSVVNRTSLLKGHGPQSDDALRLMMTNIFVASANERVIDGARRLLANEFEGEELRKHLHLESILPRMPIRTIAAKTKLAEALVAHGLGAVFLR